MENKRAILIEYGKTDYKIIIPDNADFYENYASQEFKRLFLDATGVELSIVKESEEKALSLDQTKAYFALGDTQIAKTSGLDYSYDKLKRDGHLIVTKGNTLILVGGGSYGTVYAVYGFMERQFGYRYYNPDEVFIRKSESANLLALDVVDIPDFENRTGGFYYSGSDLFYTGADVVEEYDGKPDCAIRMRTLEFFGTYRNGKQFFGIWDHNHFKFMPEEKYLDIHPDWYSPEVTQLCLSNEEMWVEFAKNVIEQIEKNNESEYFLIGQEDRNSFCGCDRCRKLIKKIGKSGVMMRFINYIGREVKKWQKANCPERKIMVGTFAYQMTAEPPVKLNKKGQYVPLAKCVVPEDNVFVMMALITGDWSVPINDPEFNAPLKKSLEGWTSLTNNCVLWYYGANFQRRFGFFDNLHVLSTNYKIFKEYKFKWLYYENNYSRQGMAFQAMMLFVHSQLAWNVDQDINALMDEFMEHYYKEACPKMKEYLNALDKYYKEGKAELSKKLGRRVGTYIMMYQEVDNVLTKEFYSYSFLQDMLKLLDQAVDCIKNAKYDKEQEKKLIDRIDIERLTIQYLIGQFFRSEFTEEEYFKFLDEFESDCYRLGVTGKMELFWTPKETVMHWKKGEKLGYFKEDKFE